jgi:predicted DNA-binding transcriptional regulator AlpA
MAPTGPKRSLTLNWATLRIDPISNEIRSCRTHRNQVGKRKTIPSSSDEAIFRRLPEVKTVIGLSKSSLYALVHANRLPCPIQLGPRTVAWVRSEIQQWAAERVLTSRSTTLHPGSKLTPQRALGKLGLRRRNALRPYRHIHFPRSSRVVAVSGWGVCGTS